MTATDIRTRFAKARATGQRHKDAAAAIGVSEGAAIAAHIHRPNAPHDSPLRATPLQSDWLALLQALQPCGPLLALTRNEHTVHEKTGVYENLSGGGKVGLALGKDIDLRLLFAHWHVGFAVTEALRSGTTQHSLQFFAADGRAVHKVFCRQTSDHAAFSALVQHFTDAARTWHDVMFQSPAPPTALCPDAEINANGLLKAWAAMQDTHEFFDLIKRFKAERQQSFRLAEGRFTRRTTAIAVRTALQTAAASSSPIMVFVGNPGCIQIHTGPVVRVEPMEIHGAHWLNVLDPGFSLHLQEDAIAHVWVVEKPTVDGIVTSVEAFDRAGELMLMLFGPRKPGEPEREDWRTIVGQI